MGLVTPKSPAIRTVTAHVERAATLGSWTIALESEAVAGTLAAFAGVLSLHKLDITSALVRKTADGLVHDTFEVVPLDHRELDDAEVNWVVRDIRGALSGEFDLAARLNALRAEFVPADHVPPVVETLDDSELTAGVKVRAADRPGLLYDIASTISAHGLRTRAVTVLTFGGRAYDTFRVVDAEGHVPHPVRVLEPLAIDLRQRCSA